MWRWALALVISTALVGGVTGPKLHKMAQIKGWRPGATVTTRFITKKGVNQGTRGSNHYWVSWANYDGTISPAHRDYVSPEVWESMEVGDPVEVIHVPGDDAGYLPNGVYVELGNFAFDIALLAVGLCVAAASAGRLLWWWVRGRKVPFWEGWPKDW
jgi:hypothetical protein